MDEAEAPAAVRPPPGHPRYPLFDSLRALAAISIFLVHSAILSQAYVHDVYWRIVAHLDIGVTIFFLLSGFLLYRPFVANRILGSPGTGIRDYARRRFLRIAPAYWVVLTIAAVIPGVYGVFSGNWWVYYGLLQNYPVYQVTGACAADGFRCGIAPTWTLAVEVAFYAVLPLFALGMAMVTNRRRNRGWFRIELAVLAVLAGISVWIQASSLDNLSPWLFFSPLGRAWWFALGMGLAAFSVWIVERGAEPAPLRWLADRAGLVWGVVAAVYLAAALFVLSSGPGLAAPIGVSRVEYVGEYLLAGLLAGAILLPAVFPQGRGGFARRVLAHPVLAWLGLVSYGIFLWHYPVLLTLLDIGILDWWPRMAVPIMTITAFAVTVGCAAASYYVVERPLMRLKYRRDERTRPRAGFGRNLRAPVEKRVR